MKRKNIDLEDTFDRDAILDALQAYKVRFILLAFLISGIYIHLLAIETEAHRAFGFPMEFYGKLADAIIIAAIIGITYEWYAKDERKRQLKQVFHDTVENISDDSDISQMDLKLTLSEVLSSDDVAMFTVFQREEGTHLVRNKIKSANESVKILGGFRATTGEKIDESSIKYHEAKKERLQADSEIDFYHLCDCKSMTKEWLDSHIQLFKASNNQASQYEIFDFNGHPPHMSIIIIDDRYVLLDLKDDRVGRSNKVKDTKLVIGTSHEEVVKMFNTHFEFVYDSENTINSAEEMEEVV